MPKVRFYDLLGVTTDEAAAALWRKHSYIRSVTGAITTDDPTDLVAYLQKVLEFQNITPGAHTKESDTSPATVGISAEVIVYTPSDVLPVPFVLTQMPDIAFFLRDTTEKNPARLFVTHKQSGIDLVIEGIPVEIRVPTDLLGPLRSEAEDKQNLLGGPDVTPTASFQPGVYDSFQITLRDTDYSSIYVHLRLRMTEELDFIIEPSIPISIGPCRFSGLPCHGLHDINFIPSPKLQDDQALEWTRHRIDRFPIDSDHSGIITIRTIDLDTNRAPLKELADKMNQGRSPDDLVEFVLEDIALPLSSLINLPIPSHGTFGLRRKIEIGDNKDEAFALSRTPVQIKWGDFRILIEQLLLKTPVSLDPLDQFVFLQMAFHFGSDPGETRAATFGITDEWTFQAGLRDPPLIGRSFKIADCSITIVGVKIGFSIKRYTSKNPSYKTTEQFQILVDFQLRTKPTSIGAFSMRSLSGKALDIIIRDIGWSLGEKTFGKGLSFPEGVQLIFGHSIKLVVEDVSLVAENNGARYISFTGGVFLFPGVHEKISKSSFTTDPAISEEKANFGKHGIKFLRLRFRIGGNPNTPDILLDGVTLFIRWGRFEIVGFGMYREFAEGGHDYKELGFGIQVKFNAFKKDFMIGMDLFYGEVKGPTDNFTYWMFGFQFSPIPIGSFKMLNIKMLLAGNMAPNLPPPDGLDQNMRLFRWYKSGNVDLSMPTNRNLNGWIRKEDSFAAALGASLSCNASDIVQLDLFLLLHKDPDQSGLLIALEVYVNKDPDDPKPVGYGALDIDFEQDKWGFMIGVDLGVNNVVGIDLGDSQAFFPKITGTLYAGNKPSTFAIGQLNDQATWASIHLDIGRVWGLEFSLQAGFCVQIVDKPEGPKGFGVVLSIKGGAKFGIGKFQIYLTAGLIYGIWRNESNVTAFLAWLELGLRIKVFGVFNFGASIKAQLDCLDCDPLYAHFSCIVKIETPWWLPDVTFSFEKVKGEPKPEQVSVISTPLVTSAAIDPWSRTQETIAVSPITGSSINELEVYSINQLRTFGEPSIPAEVIESLNFVSIDSIISLNFKPPVDDRLSVGENTPAGAGTQQSTPPAINDLKATNELIEIAIRRRPRFGTGAGVWTTLLTPEDTMLENPQDFPTGSDLHAHYLSKVSFQWDKDLICEDRLDPRRLLINASTPYTFLTKDPEADESIIRNDPGWPCCREEQDKTCKTYLLDFKHITIGQRVPSSQTFMGSSSTLHWMIPKIPIVVPEFAARLTMVTRVDGPLLTIYFDKPAFVFEMYCEWVPFHRRGILIVEAYNGLQLVKMTSALLDRENPTMPLRIETIDGMTSVLVRLSDLNVEPAGEDSIEFKEFRYCSLCEEFNRRARLQKCMAQEKRVLEGGGKLAWLPNHDYEISLTTRVILEHTKIGSQETLVKQKVFFRTKGLPGLNAVVRIGEELEKFVESRYPKATSPSTIYRSEPIALTFNENFNILLPVDRSPSPDNPDELNQILEWVLVVEKVGSSTNSQRISQTSPDWIVAHRTIVVPEPPYSPVITDSTVIHRFVRSARTLDPFQIRFENILLSSNKCGNSVPSLTRSQVLLHEPVDPSAKQDELNNWEPNSLFRVNVRNKNAPFVERNPFDNSDWTAFDVIDEENSTGTPWHITDNVMRVLGSPHDGIRRYAIFGDNDWNHIQIHTMLDPEGGAAGLAVGLADLPTVTRAKIVLVDEGLRKLRIVERRDGVTSELGSRNLPDGLSAPFALEIIVFDDRIRARVGDTVIELPQERTREKDDVREGRVALVAHDGGAFSNLIVESLDAYRFDFQSSRFINFEEHIGSFTGEVTTLPTGTAAGPDGIVDTVSSLFSITSSEIQAVMTFGSDPEIRQRVFERWVNGLSLPLQDAKTNLCLNRVTNEEGTELLVLETPEPLSFSEDVTLTLKKRTLVGSPLLVLPELDEDLVEFAVGLYFDSDGVTGLVKAGSVTQILKGGVRWLIRSEKVEDGRMKYYIYDIRLRPVHADSIQLSGKVTNVMFQNVSQEPSTDPLLGVLAGIKENEIAFINTQGKLMIPHFIPIPEVTDELIPVRVLTNGNETHTLIIPFDLATNTSTLLTPGLYHFDFDLDRVRFRSQTPDNISNSRAHASIVAHW